MSKQTRKITVLGDGGWGTTLAIHLSKKGFPVTLWGPFSDYIRELRQKRVNRRYLPDIRIPKAIRFEDKLNLAVEEADITILAIPSKYVSRILRLLKNCVLSKTIFLSVVKGIEDKTLLRTSQLIKRELPGVPLAVLSGPTIAREVASGMPASAVVAADSPKTATLLQNVLNSKTFRIYTNRDVTGVEVGGSVKNVIAIACGICDGMGFGTNTKAALLTRGLAETTRLGIALGGKAKTFAGLSGLGDLVTTCFSPQSRNRFVGEQLGKGKKIKDITNTMDMVAEGVTTVKAIHRLASRHHIAMPITEQIYKIIYNNKNPRTALKALMTRKLKAE